MTTVPTTDLPPHAYAHDSQVPAAHLRELRPVVGGGKKPTAGGLWASPITRWTDATPATSAWVERSRAEGLGDQQYDLLTEVLPRPGASVAMIDSLADLVQLQSSYPYSTASWMRWLDWEALSRDWDAVYLTDTGRRATRDTTPDLSTWDAATVLWLQPAYTLGRTVPVTA